MRPVGILLLGLMAAAAPARAAIPADPAPADSLIWVSETAAADSLLNYWRTLDNGWYEPLTIADLEMDAAGYDSLVATGDIELGVLFAGRPWKFRPLLPPGLGFNRVQGAVVDAGVEIYRPGMHQPHLELHLGYGFSWKRFSPRMEFRLPQIVGGDRDAQGRLIRSPWRKLEFELEAGRAPKTFGGAEGVQFDLPALISGYDPNNYYESTHVRVGTILRPRPWLELDFGVGGARHRPLGIRTTWNLTGGEDHIDENLQVEGLRRRTLDAGLRFRARRHDLRWTISWNRLQDSPLAWVVSEDSGNAWYRRVRLEGWITRRDPGANIWMLRGRWCSVDRAAPLEWMTWLGDEGTLRGYELMELGGDRGGFASLDVRWNVDPFEAMKIPLLRDLHLRQIPFVDYDSTLLSNGSTLPSGETGWRADAGFGLGKMVGMIPEPMYLRLYAARPIDDDHGRTGWRFLMVFEMR